MCKNITIPIGYNYTTNSTNWGWELRNSDNGRCPDSQTPFIIYLVVILVGIFIFSICLYHYDKASKKLEAERVERQMNPEMRFEDKDAPIVITMN